MTASEITYDWRQNSADVDGVSRAAVVLHCETRAPTTTLETPFEGRRSQWLLPKVPPRRNSSRRDEDSVFLRHS